MALTENANLKDGQQSFKEYQELIGEAVTMDPWDLTPKFIKVLPKAYVKRLRPMELSRIWDELPNDLRNDIEIKERLPCMKHYNRPEDTIHIDGPPPAKYRCFRCKKENSGV